MADVDPKRAWVKRVLSVEVGAGGNGQGPSTLPAALTAWRQALDKVDGQISALQKVLRGSPDEDLHEIAEFGLNAITGSNKIKLQAALTELPAKKAVAARLAGAFAAHIAADKRVAACDANPFGVALSVRATLGPALAALQAALQSAPG